MDEYTKTIQKTKAINNERRYCHEKSTHPDEVHEEYVKQLPYDGDEVHRERLQE